jgi:eukaryotic-like serine/threonine-protein kinase
MPFAPGDRLGPYEILARIGAGGMGEVWKARDTRLDRVVAIKRLNVQHGARFEAEARAVAALNHPHICQIFDVGPDYLVLEFVSGAPLRGPAPEAEALRLGIQIAGALEAAHERGILHRDLKPDNVMVTKTGAKLLDFGLAKLSGDSAADVTQTGEGMVVGTAPYMSPEQARAKPLDARSDIFSFGAVLYELLSGRRAFGGDTMLDILNAVVGREPAPLDSAAWPAIQRCLAKDPARRFASATELREALEQGIRGQGSGIRETAALPPSIAVLPFANMSGDREQEYFSDGLTEEIINALVKVPGLKVIARTSAFAFKGQNADVRRIAETLGVAHVMEGSVRRSGNRLRVTAQLITAADGSHLWSERYDREMADVFEIQDELSAAIAGMLQAKLTASGVAAAPPRYVPKVEAHEALLKARHLQFQHTPQALARAGEYFEQAIALDAGYALAHASYAEYLFTLVQQGMWRAQELMPRVRAEARKALELDASLGEAHVMLAGVAALYEYDWEESARRYAQAMAGGPLSATSRAYCAMWVLRLPGRFEESLQQARLAAQEDPLSPFVQSVLAFSLMGVGQTAEARAQFRNTLELAPSFMIAVSGLTLFFACQGKYREALGWAEKAYAGAPEAPFISGALAGLLARSGDTARAEKLLAEIRSGPAPRASVALMYYALYTGDVDGAADWAERVIEDRYPGLAIGLTSEIARPLRESARWGKLAAMMNLPG